MNIREIKYSTTNTYLIEGERGKLLFDTGWAGTFTAFCRALGDLNISLQEIDYVLISHYHPDHMGISQEIADHGPKIIAVDFQKPWMHTSDRIFEKEKNKAFIPIREEDAIILPLQDSRQFLLKLGIKGEIIPTPGHSDDSISLCLDNGAFFVGDLNPLYEKELHQYDEIGKSWEKLLERKPEVIYYGHAKTIYLGHPEEIQAEEHNEKQTDTKKAKQDLYELTGSIMKLIDKRVSLEKIQKKTGADSVFIEDVARMYLTHQNIGVQGILDRIEIKGK